MSAAKVNIHPPEIKERILRAAARVFAEKSYAGARVDEIARRAGVNKALLYYHVGNKNTLYGAVILDNLERSETNMKEALAKAANSEDRFRAVVTAFTEMAATAPYLPRLILREAAFGGVRLPEPVLHELARIFNVIREVLDEGVREGQFRSVDPLLTHFMITGSIMFLTASGPLRQRLRSLEQNEVPAGAAVEDISSLVIELLLNGLRRRDGRCQQNGSD